MVEISRLVGIALVLTMLAVFLRGMDRTLALQLTLGFVVFGLLYLMGPLRQVIALFLRLGAEARIESAYLAIVLKSMAVAYVAGFGAQLSRDADEGAIAEVVELVGKVIILLMSVPVIAAILDALLRLLS
ncbi:MAG TPA: stage III sporulation protein AD [Limnochordia bacterium]